MVMVYSVSVPSVRKVTFDEERDRLDAGIHALLELMRHF
jgi:hypothetical protein